MAEGEEPPSKRAKVTELIEFFQLQELGTDISQASNYAKIILHHLSGKPSLRKRTTVDGNFLKEDKLVTLVHETKKLRDELHDLVSYLKGEPKVRTDPHSENFIITFRITATYMRNVLSTTELISLASTSKHMFNLLAPLFDAKNIDQLPFRQPEDETKFRYLRPSTFVDVEECEDVPSHVTNITFSKGFGSEISNLPPTLTHIKLSNKFDKILDNLLPLSLTHLSFGENFNTPISYLPPSLLYLSFPVNSVFNQIIAGLPPTLTHLILADAFDRPLVHLPPSLKVLSTGSSRSVNRLPNSIHTLVLNTPEPLTSLPSSLTFLSNSYRDQPLTFPLPSSLSRLHVCDLSSPNALSHLTSLSHLEIKGDNFTPGYDKLPKSLTTLVINGECGNVSLDSLPPSLTHLDICCISHNVPLDFLPKSLTHLSLSLSFNSSLTLLPSSLTHLEFRFDFNSNVDNLPPNLTHLTFGFSFDKSVDHLPRSLTHLTFSYSFNQPVDRLPPRLTHLIFGHKFNRKVDYLPSSLINLTFGNCFNQPIEHLPTSLKSLFLSFDFCQPIYHLPFALSHLTMLIISSESVKTLFSHNLSFPSHFEKIDLIIASGGSRFSSNPNKKGYALHVQITKSKLSLFSLSKKIFSLRYPDTMTIYL